MIRNELMKIHRTLSLGSPEDMTAANIILRLLRERHIMVGDSDAECQVLILLEDLGAQIRYILGWAIIHI